MCGSKLIQDWPVHNVLVNVAKLGGKGFNITGTSYACQRQFTLPFPCYLYLVVPE